MTFMGRSKMRKSDTLSSSLRELERAQAELLESDPFYEEIQQRMKNMIPGNTVEFPGLTLEKRRKVHLAAAELGYTSESYSTPDDKRVVVVKNMGLTVEIVKGWGDTPTFLSELRNEVTGLFTTGVPAGSGKLLTGAAIVSTIAILSPAIFGKVAADLVLPLATGSVSLITVAQESEGKATVAKVKENCGRALAKQGDAELTLGLAAMTGSALPAYMAVAICATTSSFFGFEGGKEGWGLIFSIGSLLICGTTNILSVDRQRRIR